MSKLEDSAKGEKSFGMMIYEPPYMCTRVTCPDGHLFRRVEICFPYVRCEGCTGSQLTVSRLLDSRHIALAYRHAICLVIVHRYSLLNINSLPPCFNTNVFSSGENSNSAPTCSKENLCSPL